MWRAGREQGKLRHRKCHHLGNQDRMGNAEEPKFCTVEERVCVSRTGIIV